MYESIYKIAAINPLTPSLFVDTATTEDTAEANVGVTAITMGALDADASTTSDVSSPNTAFIFPSRSSEILAVASSLALDFIHDFIYNKYSYETEVSVLVNIQIHLQYEFIIYMNSCKK
jgi:hypothetical protein